MSLSAISSRSLKKSFDSRRLEYAAGTYSSGIIYDQQQMTSTTEAAKFGVCGAGTMGSGIAYAAALAGYDVRLYDIAAEPLERGAAQIAKNIQGSLERGKLTEESAAE